MVSWVALAVAAPGIAADQERVLPGRVEEVLWWLPEDTQAITVAQGPFDRERFLDHREFAAHLGLETETEVGPLAERTIAVTVRAGRRFRNAKGIGAWPFAGAFVTIFEKPLGKAGDEVKKSLADSAAFDNEREITTQRIRGHDAVVKRETRWKDDWTTFVVQPTPNVLIHATDRAFLEETLDRIERRAKTRALPATLPEWKLVDTTSPVWAIRHYDRKDSAHDPSSPLSEHGSFIRDRQAIGLVFDFNPARGRVASVKYLTGRKDAYAVAKRIRDESAEAAKAALKEGDADAGELRPERVLNATLHDAGPGVVDVRVPIEGSAGTRQAHGMFFLLLNQLLGHGMNL